MGGRGSSYQRVVSAPLQPAQAVQQLQPDPLNTGPAPTGVTQADLANMSDTDLHDFLINVNQTDIPSFLNDVHLQRMLYALGMNDTPEIVSEQEFDDMTVNAPFGSGMKVLYRTVNDTVINGVPFTSQNCCDMLTDGDLTYVGNGVHGDGLYFSDSLSGSKMYGDSTGRTVGAVLNSKAKVISEQKLQKEYDSFVKSHPQTRKALGFARSKSSHDSLSQFALIRGYNVISYTHGWSNETYYTVIDRSALTMSRKQF